MKETERRTLYVPTLAESLKFDSQNHCHSEVYNYYTKVYLFMNISLRYDIIAVLLLLLSLLLLLLFYRNFTYTKVKTITTFRIL